MRRCEVHVLKVGSCRHPEATSRRGASLRPATFPALAGLILHPVEGPVLFDTGYDPAFLTATEAMPGRLYRFATPVSLAEGEEVSARLGRYGLAPADIAWVVLSHFHGDHIAGLKAFPRARIACSHVGLIDAREGGEIRAVLKGVLRGLIPRDLDRRARFFEDCAPVALPPDLSPFETGADLFGDGSLIMVQLPGHCPGHWGLMLRGEDDRTRFFVGDAAWSGRAIRDNVPPPAFATALLGATGPYRETLARLHRLSKANPALDLIPSHCPEQAARAEGLGDA